MYCPKIYSYLMAAIQDQVSIVSASFKVGVHSQNIKDLISNFESAQQDRVFNKQKNLI